MDIYKDYKKAVEYLYGLGNIPKPSSDLNIEDHPDLPLKRAKYFLKLLGNPQKDFKYVHVTGTSGKGTVTSLIHRALVLSGKQSGLLISPHVSTTIERIKVGDLYIPPSDFARIIKKLKPYIDLAYLKCPYGGPSFFEIILAVALVYFQERKCEWVVLEVSVGGKYDATNIINKAEAVVVTNVDYDHTNLLGDTLTKIAEHKAGIIKKGSSFWTTERRPRILKLFKEKCEDLKVPFHSVYEKGIDYQEANLRLVAEVCEEIGIEASVVDRATSSTLIPCRFEKVQDNPKVVLDGAHNKSKIESIVHNLEKEDYSKLSLVIGFKHNKDVEPMVELVAPYADRIFVTRYEKGNGRCANPTIVHGFAKKYKRKKSTVEMFLDPQKALDEAVKNAGKNDLVLVTGSFYLVGELRKRWYPEEYVLKKRKSF